MIANDGLSSPVKIHDRIGHNGWKPTINGERNVIKKLFHFILVAMLVSTAIAQNVSVRPDHPDEYVVVKGDTLWDISGRFLQHPWQWPAIWHTNPQIENPHLIYPGDRVSLVYIDGQPRLVVNGNRRTVKMSPGLRQSSREAIQPIEWDAIKSFVTNVRVLMPGTFTNLPYVVSNERGRHSATVKDPTFVRGIDGRVGEEYAIVRLRHIYYDDNGVMKRAKNSKYGEHFGGDRDYPGDIWSATMSWRRMNPEVLGYEFWDIAVGRIVKEGDPAVLEIQSGRTEVVEGDFILPIDEYKYAENLLPHAMSQVPEGMEVIALTQAKYGSGHYQVVAINAGRNQGVESGHVFSAFRPGEKVQDEVKYPIGSWEANKTLTGDKVVLPDLFSAHLLVFRVFDEVSYAIIMDGRRPVREHDILKHPDETV